mmetsp:Transcript_8164/g.15367  ORF Transcript_8164/g.15367 Transcript_8164/m.15367 type:complete len:236 (-) Transcript_8164:108-815(-)
MSSKPDFAETIPQSHPLKLLDEFLYLLPIVSEVESDIDRISNNQKIVEIGDFLYGKSISSDMHRGSAQKRQMPPRPSTSILDGALEILEGSWEETQNTHSHVPVRMIIARESGRRVMIVRGSSSGGQCQEYICTFGFRDMNRQCSEKNSRYRHYNELAIGRMGYHCSCRSFFERLKFDKFAICKHLLAARLAPFLSIGESCDEANYKNISIYVEQELEEEEFATIYARMSLSSWH